MDFAIHRHMGTDREGQARFTSGFLENIKIEKWKAIYLTLKLSGGK
jgi:hypothetical protein